MANKKINELDIRTSLSLADLMVVGDPTTGYAYKTTLTDLKTLIGGGVTSFNGRVGAVVPAEGDYSLTQLSDVIITSASSGQVLKFNGTSWVNAAEDSAPVLSVNTKTGAVVLVTDDIAEDGSPVNLWYTDARSRAAISETITGIEYNSSTGVFSLTSGYIIPTTASQGNWDTAYNRSLTAAAVSGTTTKTLTLTKQDGSTLTASWTDINTDAVTSVFGRTGAVVAANGDYTTAQITESGNLYYTDARARAALSLTTTGSSGAATYNSSTGVFNIPTYTLTGLGGVPSSRTITINGTGYDLSADRTFSIPTDNIYNANGTLTGARTVTLGGNNLTFTGSSTSAVVHNSGRLLLGGASDNLNYVLNATGSATISNSLNVGVRIDASTVIVQQNIWSATTRVTSYSEIGLISSISNPGAGFGFLYGKSTDKKIYWKDSDGIEYDLTSNSGGTVTSVSALTIGTTGTDITSTVANSTTTPVITLNIPSASATARGVVTTSTQTFAGVKTFSGSSTIFDSLIDLGTYARFQKLTLSSGSPSTGKAYLWYKSSTNTLYFRNDANQEFDLTVGSGGTVTTLSVVSANGFAGTVANASTTPEITISTTISGLLKGNGTAISAAVAGTDYQSPITLTTTGSSGAATFSSNTLNIPTYTLSGLGGVPTSRTLTINGTGYDLSNDRSWSVGTITSLTGEASASGTGAVTITLDNASVIGKVLTGLNLTGGGTIASTDTILQAFGKVQNQISAMVGGVTYQGTWNASTNTPSLTSSVGTKGYYYVVATAGSTNLNGITDWKIGDWVIFNGSTWDKVDNTDAVSSVNGYTGAVSLSTSDIGEGTNLYFTNTRAQNAITLTTSGTSGAATYTGGTLNIPAYSLSGLGGVPTSTTLTINGTAYDLSANRSWSVGTVTSVAALTLGTTGTDVSSTVANGTTTPVITLNIPTASATNRGALSSADWTTFNGKFNLPSLTSGSVLFSDGTTIAQDNSNFFWDNTNKRLGIGTASPSYTLQANGTSTAGFVTAIVAKNPSTNAASAVKIGFDGGGTIWGEIGASYNSNAPYMAFFVRAASEKMRITDGGNIGIGTLTPIAYGGYTALSINNATNGGIIDLLVNDVRTGSIYTSAGGAGLNINTVAANPLIFLTTNTERMRITSGGNLLIGTTTDSGEKLQVSGTMKVTGAATFSSSVTAGSKIEALFSNTNTIIDANPYLRLVNTGVATINQSVDIVMRWQDGTYNGSGGISMVRESATGRSGSLVFSSINSSGNDTRSLILNSSSNLGLGVTPSAWISGNLAFEIVSASGLSSDGTSIRMQTNAFVNTSGNWQYKSNGAASFYSTGAGAHSWYTAPSGTAGNAITFTQAMTLTAAGRLLLGTTTEGSQRLQVVGTSYFDGDVNITNTGTASGKIYINGTQSSARQYLIQNAITSVSNSGFEIRDVTGGFTPFYISSTGAATFSSTATATAFIPSGSTVPSNGLYLPATNEAALSTNTTERMRIFSTGKISINTSTSGRQLTINSSTADDHLLICGTTPSVSMTDAVTGATYQAKFGLATATNNFATGSAAGDFVISCQAGSTIWAYNSVEKMRMNTSGRLLVGTATDPGLGTVHVSGGISTDAPSGGTAAKWKFGSKVTASVTLDTGNYIEVEIGGVAYKLAIVS